MDISQAGWRNIEQNLPFHVAFRGQITGRSCGGRDLGDSDDWKIAQPGQDRQKVLLEDIERIRY